MLCFLDPSLSCIDFRLVLKGARAMLQLVDIPDILIVSYHAGN